MTLIWSLFGKKINVETPEASNQGIELPGGIRLVKAPDGSLQRMFMDSDGRQSSLQIQGFSFHGSVSEQSLVNHAFDPLVSSQFPARVKQICAQAGQSLKKGFPLFILESMKMEFPLKIYSQALVQEIYVQEGESIRAGQVLARLVSLRSGEP